MTQQWYFFNFLKIFLIFLEFSIMRQVGTEWNRTIIFIFSHFRPIPTYYGLKWSRNGIFKFSEFFCYFFGIFYYVSSRNETERNDKFLFSLFLGLFQPFFALNEATLVFFNFLKIFLIFLEFSIMRQVGTELNKTIIFFSLFFGLFQHIMAWNETTMVFWNFLNFIAILLEFSITLRVRTKRNDNFCFPSFLAFSCLFWL